MGKSTSDRSIIVYYDVKYIHNHQSDLAFYVTTETIGNIYGNHLGGAPAFIWTILLRRQYFSQNSIKRTLKHRYRKFYKCINIPQIIFQTTCKACVSNILANFYNCLCKLAEFSCPTSSISWEDGNACCSGISYYQYYAQSSRDVSDDLRNLWTDIMDNYVPNHGSTIDL